MAFGPRCYGVFEDPVDIIVLEDLKQTGYAIGDRCVGLELDHALLAVEKASQFHAASLIYLEKHGQFDKKFNDGLFSAKMYTGEWKQYYQALSQIGTPNLSETLFLRGRILKELLRKL